MSHIEDIKGDLSSKFKIDNYKFENAFGNDVLEVPKSDVVEVLQHLKLTGQFNFLMDVGGADYPERERRFDVIYHLFSSKDSRRLRIKTQVGENETVDTATSVWRGANWFER